ncbi:uncharacterized protein LOC124495068 [Dermatophagoides farinae]|uniref:uncharacterized protein LOC124495068 n=1 Tax=Dermatophagoides farinae TaxID=6954 RepID=UPI003F63ABC7
MIATDHQQRFIENNNDNKEKTNFTTSSTLSSSSTLLSSSLSSSSSLIESQIFINNNHYQQQQQQSYPNMDNNEHQGITKRTVIIHKDSRGYGMRISGDNPVFIQHVNEEGAAYKAGVRSGDQIVKVNGTLVTRMGHAEVVRMIQSCGAFVGLTLHTTTTNTTAATVSPNSNQSLNNTNNNNNNNNGTTNTTTLTSSSSDLTLRHLSPANSPIPPANNNNNNNIQSHGTNSVSMTSSSSPFATVSTSSNYSSMYPMNMVILTSNNPIQITGPQPVPESTQQQYHENQIRTLKEMINKEHRHLEGLKLMCAKQTELDSCQKRINEMTSKLEMHQSNITAYMNNNSSSNNHSRQHSFENSTSPSVQDFSSPSIITHHHHHHQRTNSSDQSIIGSNSKSPRIMPMDEDVDNDAENSGIYPYEYIEDFDIDRDVARQQSADLTSSTAKSSTIGIAKSVSNPSVSLRPGNNSRDKTKRDSKIMPIFETPIESSSGGGGGSILNPKSWYNIHLDSLRMSRYLIQHKMQPPNELLFYVMARNVFPRIVTSTAIPAVNKFQVIQRWAYQIIATFVTKESPLFIQEFQPDFLEQFDRNLTALISANPSATDVIASPFDPFLMAIYETLRKQWEEFMMATSSSSQMMNSNPKHDLQAIIEMLFTTHTHICMTPQQQPSTPTIATNSNMKIDLRDIDPILDSFVALVKSHQSESTMALISSLLAIGRYIFHMTTSKHCLLLECSGPGSSSSSSFSSSISSALPINSNNSTNTNTSNNLAQVPTLNPLLKLSSESSRSSKSGHKRNSMIPIGSKSFTSSSGSHSLDLHSHSNVGSGITGSGGGGVGSIVSSSNLLANSGFTIEDRSHSFVSIVEMNHIIYCTSCMLPMWGDPYTWKCTKCLMYTHQWCRKIAAANNICNNDTHHQHQNSTSSQQSQSGSINNKNNRRAKSEKKSVFEKFAVGKRRRNHPSDFNIFTSLARTQSSCSSSSSTSSISSEISSSDLDDFILSTTNLTTPNNNNNNNNKNTVEDDGSMLTNRNQECSNIIASTSATPNLVNRSGSFVQRKKKKSCTSVGSPRKRSDPALTSRQMISTMANNGQNMMIGGVETVVAATSGTLPQLTSARSSGALMNSASVGAHDSVQFRPITGQRAKHMTASDSSLMSVTSHSMKSRNPIPGSSSNGGNGVPIFSNTESQKSSSTNLTSTSSPRRTRHRNTNDSAIQMDGSSEDDIDDQQLNESETPATTILNETDVEKTIPQPPPPPPPPPSSLVPPPLPPRPDSQTEKRRQIQMEIIQTEEEHYEVLRHIRKIYQKPLKKEKLFSSEQIDIIFGNIKELRLIHKKIFVKMNHAHKLHMQSMSLDSYYLEETLHEIFCGELGTQLEQEASKFCVNRKIRNGTELWNQRKKDSRLRQWVDSECRTRSIPDNPLARLGLDDLLSRVFQRPLRYPLLFERLLKSTLKDSPGHRYLEQVMISIRRSNERINEETKKAELRARLVELIRKTDFSNSSFQVNLEQHELLHEGPLIWRITKQKLVDVLLVLTDQIILVLTRESNDRYVLRTHINPTTKHEHRPHVKMDDLLMRDVATDQSAFFLVSKNQDIIYEFAAQTTSERKKWKEIITEAINKYRTNRSIPHQLQTQRSFTSSRSMTMMDLKSTTTNDLIANNHPHYHHQHQHQQQQQPPPLPPPIQNRPLPKPPIDSQHSSSSPPPPIPPPSAASFANRPLPQPPSDSTQPPPLPSTPYPTRVDGNVQVVTANERHPSNIDFIPFSQVKISSEQNRSGQLNRNKTDDLQEISDNLQNMIQERRRSGIRNYEDLAREIREMSLVYDVAKHDDSKEILIRLITDMFRKATEWSYHLIQDNDPAKQELSQRVRNSVESFVKSHIDSNFILPLPGDDIDSNVECPETLFDNNSRQPSTLTNDNISASPSSSSAIVESIITPMMANVRLSASAPTAPRPHSLTRIRRSLSDNYEKSDKTKKTGLEPIIHDDLDSNLIDNESNDNNYDIVTEENFRFNTTQKPKLTSSLSQTINDSSNMETFDNITQLKSKSQHNSSRHSAPIISPVPLSSSSSSSNPFISSEIMNAANNIMTATPTAAATTTTTNLEINSLGFTEEFVVVLDDGDVVVDDENNHHLDDHPNNLNNDNHHHRQQIDNDDADDELISNDVDKENLSISNTANEHNQTTQNITTPTVTTTTSTSQMYLI